MSGPVPIVLCGPTASGKTALALQLCRALNGEMVIADSRQVIRGLRVATCTPTDGELDGVPCHLRDVIPPGARYTAADWARGARTVIADCQARGASPVICGGTGLFLRALTDGYGFGAPARPERRAELEAIAARPGGLTTLVAMLRRHMPDDGIDTANPRRVIRAIERAESGDPTPRVEPAVACLEVGLAVDPAVLNGRIAARAEAMLRTGALVAETEAALAHGVSAKVLDRCGIGYREAIAVMAGRQSPSWAVEEIARRTRRYAKAQRTWWRAQSRVHWIDAGHRDPAAGLAAVLGLLRRALP